MSASVREARACDLEQLADLCAEHAIYERASIAPPSLERLSAALFATPHRLHAWVAESAHGLIGYSTAAKEFSTWSAREFMHLDCLYVRATQRGQGIGRRLIDAVIAHAAALDIEELQWQTPSWNLDAQRFYARLGAQAAEKVRFTLKRG